MTPYFESYDLRWRKRVFFSRYLDTCYDGRILNYSQKPGYYEQVYDNRQKKKRFRRKAWRKKHHEIQSKQYYIVGQHLKEQREEAYKHHWHSVWILTNNSFLGLVTPEKEAWLKENTKKGWNFSTEYVNSNMSNKPYLSYDTYDVYWFEDPEDAFMFKMVWL